MPGNDTGSFFPPSSADTAGYHDVNRFRVCVSISVDVLDGLQFNRIRNLNRLENGFDAWLSCGHEHLSFSIVDIFRGGVSNGRGALVALLDNECESVNSWPEAHAAMLLPGFRQHHAYSQRGTHIRQLRRVFLHSHLRSGIMESQSTRMRKCNLEHTECLHFHIKMKVLWRYAIEY